MAPRRWMVCEKSCIRDTPLILLGQQQSPAIFHCTVPSPPQPPWLEQGVLKQDIKKALSSSYILIFLHDLDSFLVRILDQGVLWIHASLPDWWDLSLSESRIYNCHSLPRTTIPPSRSRPEAKTSSALYRICGIARSDRESVDASLKGSTGERSGETKHLSTDADSSTNTKKNPASKAKFAEKKQTFVCAAILHPRGPMLWKH